MDYVEWVDLSRLGATLQVVGKSPLRDQPMLCLEVEDLPAFFERNFNALGSEAEVLAAQKGWWDLLREFGFNISGRSAVGLHAGSRYLGYSSRQIMAFPDLVRLFPGLLPEDIKPIPLEQVYRKHEPSPEKAEAWRRYFSASDEAYVWVIKGGDERFNRSWPDAQDAIIYGTDLESRQLRARWFNGSTLLFLSHMSSHQYRDNALISYYPDIETAIADGRAERDVEQVQLPYSVPLWVEKSGQVVAFRDASFFPEIMHAHPEEFVSSVQPRTQQDRLLITATREARALSMLYEKQIEKWKQWAAEAEQVDLMMMDESVRAALQKHLAVSAEHPVVKRPSTWLFTGGDVRSMKNWTGREVDAFASAAGMFLRDGTAKYIESTISEILSRHHDVVKEKRREKAEEIVAEGVKSLREFATEPELDLEKQSVRHEDVGEKIGGARKDYAKRAMSADDLRFMNSIERTSLVVKKNVWPPLNYGELRTDGVHATTAMAIKVLKDSISVDAGSGPRSETESAALQRQARYIDEVAKIRDAMSQVKTDMEFIAACERIYNQPSPIDGVENRRYLLNVIGWNATKLIAETVAGRVLPYKARAAIHKRARPKWGDLDEQKLMDSITQKIWDSLIKTKAGKTEEEKRALSDKQAHQALLHRPHLDHVIREGGENWRQGRDVTAPELMDKFNFRAIEFGNWLPQDERQEVLNMAYDSFCDLTVALQLPPESMSLDGKLAIAFGSRGQGGKRAALAHFESSRNVINMTRMNGAGSLAHEWFHALDWEMGGGQLFLSTKTRAYGDDRCSEAMLDLVSAMKGRRYTQEEYRNLKETRLERFAGQAKVTLVSLLGEKHKGDIAREIDAQVQVSYDDIYIEAIEHLEALSSLAQQGEAIEVKQRGIRTHDSTPAMEQQKEGVMGALRKFCLDKGVELCRSAEMPLLLTVDCWIRTQADIAIVHAAKELNTPIGHAYFEAEGTLDTTFYKDALSLDKERSSPYWAEEYELLARAGAQYVQYELKSRGVRSDYLVYGSEESRLVGDDVASPNPGAEDRIALRPLFEKLVTEYRNRLVLRRDVEMIAEELNGSF